MYSTRSFLENSYVINLAHRKDRLGRVQRQCLQLGITFQRFEAVSWTTMAVPKDWVGKDTDERVIRARVAVTRSHRGVIEHARDIGLPYVAVFEDDVFFSEQRFSAWPGDLPEDWVLLLLGWDKPPNGMPGFPARPMRHAAGCWHDAVPVWGRHAYIVRATGYDRLIDIWSNETDTGDTLWSAMLLEEGSYCAKPKFCFQRDRFSDITQNRINRRW